jgi:hypothetical protein
VVQACEIEPANHPDGSTQEGNIPKPTNNQLRIAAPTATKIAEE